MSTAQAKRLTTHLQMLADSGANISAFPDVAELMKTWGASQFDVPRLVALVREGCPPGYIVPFVCGDTEGRVLMAQWNGKLFNRALAALTRDMKYVLTRSRRIARNIENLLDGVPVSTATVALRSEMEGIILHIRSSTHPTIGPMALAARRIPLLAYRATVTEKTYLNALAAKAALSGM